jgi:hypothetical protein
MIADYMHYCSLQGAKEVVSKSRRWRRICTSQVSLGREGACVGDSTVVQYKLLLPER